MSKQKSPGQLLVPLIVGCALFMELLDSTIITTALPAMARSLHQSPVRLNLGITSYLLSLAVFIPISGWMADRFGARSVFRAAILIFTCGSVLCGMCRSLPQLVMFRILQGMGGAMMVPVGRLLVLKLVPKSDLVQALAYLSIPAQLGPLLGPPVGGLIVTFWSWRWIFYINVPIGFLGIMLVTLYIPDLREEAVPPLDLPGFALTGLGLAGLVFALETAGRDMFPTSLIVAATVAGTLCLVLYWFHFRRSTHPMIDLGLMKLPTFATATVPGGLCRAGSGAMSFLLALQLQVGFGLSAFSAGLLVFTSAIGSFAMRLTVQPIVRRFGFRQVLTVNAVITAVSIALCALFHKTTPHSVIIAILFVGGFFRALQFTSLNALAYAEVSSALMSNASSLASMAQQLSFSFGITISAFALHTLLAMHGEARLTARDFSPVFVLNGLITLASAFFFFRMERYAGGELSGHHAAVEASEPSGEQFTVAD